MLFPVMVDCDFITLEIVFLFLSLSTYSCHCFLGGTGIYFLMHSIFFHIYCVFCFEDKPLVNIYFNP